MVFCIKPRLRTLHKIVKFFLSHYICIKTSISNSRPHQSYIIKHLENNVVACQGLYKCGTKEAIEN